MRDAAKEAATKICIRTGCTLKAHAALAKLIDSAITESQGDAQRLAEAVLEFPPEKLSAHIVELARKVKGE